MHHFQQIALAPEIMAFSGNIFTRRLPFLAGKFGCLFFYPGNPEIVGFSPLSPARIREERGKEPTILDLII
jgi:hypothetical protein